jgi:hypothetical protein
LLHRLLAFRKYVQVVERRGYSHEVLKALLDREAKDKAFFGNKDELDVLAEELSGPSRTVTVQADEEHNLFLLSVEDRSNGYPRHYSIGLDFVTTGEYRTLAGSYRDIDGLEGPMVVVTQAAAAGQDADNGEVTAARADNTAIGGGELDRPTKLAAEPKDNEPAAINGAGVQLYVVSGQRKGGWLLVPVAASRDVGVLAIEGWEKGLTVSAKWQPTESGYAIVAEVALPSGTTETALDVIVNETAPGRERRRGQLVLSGARGEFVYLRGDRHDVARLLRFTIRRRNLSL